MRNRGRTRRWWGYGVGSGALLVLLAVALAQVRSQEGQKWAVVVGIGAYDNDIQPLEGAVNDALAVTGALVEAAGFAADHVYLLTSDQPEGPPRKTSAGIQYGPPKRAVLLKCLSGLAQTGLVGAQDTVVFYTFNGHEVSLPMIWK